MAYTPKTWVNSNPITASDLNRIETGVANIDARLVPLETASGIVTDTVTAASGWSRNGSSVYKKGNVVSLNVSFNRTGAAITGTTSGNLPQTTLGTIPAGYRPVFDQPLSTTATGVVYATCIDSAGVITLSATVPNFTIPTGETINVGGTYLIS